MKWIGLGSDPFYEFKHAKVRSSPRKHDSMMTCSMNMINAQRTCAYHINIKLIILIIIGNAWPLRLIKCRAIPYGIGQHRKNCELHA